MLVVLAFAAFVAVVVALAVWSHKKNQARIQSLMQLALSRNWQFVAHDPFGLAQRWSGTPFDSGYDRRAQNVVTGEHDGRPLVAFDYSYKEDSTDSKGNRRTSTYHYAVVAIGMPCALPELHIGPEGVFARIGKAMGMEDIELESEDFNRRFRVRCPDPKLAMDVLTPRTMELLLANGAIRFRFAGSDLVAYDSGVLTPVELLRAVHVLCGVLNGVPSFVWRDRTPSSGNLT
jgi:hypothetical protein